MITLSDIYDIFRFAFFAVFVGLHAVLMIGIVLEWKRDRLSLRKAQAQSPEPAAERAYASEGSPPGPQVSVIIPVHNESHRIEGLLRSLAVQEYKKAEFIFVDDRSSDESAKMIQDFIRDRPGMRLISVTENSALNHKQYALCKGIEVSSGEFILFTDADCEIPPGWIASMVKRVSNPEIGAVLGPVFKKPGGTGSDKNIGFFHLYQCFDHAVRYMYLTASTGIGAAGGGFGNNMIFRRASLDAVGGYANLPPSPTEDAALVSMIRSHSRYKIRAAVGTDVHVTTSGENNWKDFVPQALRWNNGGLFSPDLATRFNFGFLMITISMGIIAIPLLPFFPSLWPLAAAVMISMTGNSIAIMALFRKSLPKKSLAYIVQTVFTPMYFTFLTILGLCGVKGKWKGDEIS